MYFALIYLFPVILIAMEFCIRFAVKVDLIGFIGPTLCAAALTTLLPTVRPKTREIADVDGSKVLVISPLDNQLIPACWLLLFVMLLAWGIVCYLSSLTPVHKSFGGETQYVVGVVCYVVSVVMVGVKSRVK